LVYSFKDNVICISQQNKIKGRFLREVVINNIKTGKKEYVTFEGRGSNCNYVLGSRLYYDEYIASWKNPNAKYVIKYIDLNTLKKYDVCMYDMAFHDARFVLRADGDVSLSINDLKGISHIIIFNDGDYKEVIAQKWVDVVDYTSNGLFYTIPDCTVEELDKKEYSFQVNSYKLILKNESGNEKVLLTRQAGSESYMLGAELKIFDNYFIRINEQEVYYIDYFEVYNFKGELIKKIMLNQWPKLGKSVTKETFITYYDGAIRNLFYRGDIDKLEVQTIKLKD